MDWSEIELARVVLAEQDRIKTEHAKKFTSAIGAIGAAAALRRQASSKKMGADDEGSAGGSASSGPPPSLAALRGTSSIRDNTGQSFNADL